MTILDGYGRSAEMEPSRVLRLGQALLKDLRTELQAAERSNATERENAVSDLWGTIFNQFPQVPYQSNTLSGPITLSNANNYVPISLNYILLSYAYMTNGFIRTVVKEPVDDAFRNGFELVTDELDEEEKKMVLRDMRRIRSRKEVKQMRGSIGQKVQYNSGQDLQRSDFSAIKHTCYWGRLYGGAGMIINVDQDFRKELREDQIEEDSPLEFIPADRWELVLAQNNLFSDANPCPFGYYGYPIHASRVLKFLWNEAPSYIRLRLQGWGMSEVEHCIRPINAFLKFENLLFELMDEAKIDVYKLQNFASTITSGQATNKIRQAMLRVNQIKNFQSGIVLDKNDDYDQKQLSFGGLAELREQGRMDLAASLRFPLNKLFGDSATGFGGGQDAMENYNAMVMTLREDVRPLVIKAAELRCQKRYGFIPEDLDIKFHPLREMSGVEEEQVLTERSNRTLAWFQAGLMDAKEASQQAKNDRVLTVETGILKGERDAVPHAQMADEIEKERTAFNDRRQKQDGQKDKKRDRRNLIEMAHVRNKVSSSGVSTLIPTGRNRRSA